MPVRHIYLKIESIPEYLLCAPIRCLLHYGRDCMRNAKWDMKTDDYRHRRSMRAAGLEISPEIPSETTT